MHSHDHREELIHLSLFIRVQCPPYSTEQGFRRTLKTYRVFDAFAQTETQTQGLPGCLLLGNSGRETTSLARLVPERPHTHTLLTNKQNRNYRYRIINDLLIYINH